ncbi:BQ2448_7287 [Microbotryum intermedium]|uniref:BQ2448_7287 protein n=1 Tax=Microbotryum intermedium TaxID=269621 RepID=A0A238FMI0_9BASI|nr:BQ2448_7287 [Microbotryum intermedium]
MKFFIPLSVLASALHLSSAAPAAEINDLHDRSYPELHPRAIPKCSSSQFLDPKTNKCQDCTTAFPNALTCNKNGPVKCSYGAVSANKCQAVRCKDGQWPGKQGRHCEACPLSDLVKKCNADGSAKECKRGNLNNGKCQLAKCRDWSSTYLSDDGRRCLRCADKNALECTSTTSLRCKENYAVSEKGVCVKITCEPPKVLAQDKNGCCIDPNASACSDEMSPTACKNGYQLKNGVCRLIVCKAPLAVVSDDGTGCCFDPHATKCSDRITSTACAVGYKLDGDECKVDESRTCKPPLAIVSDDKTGCCFDPHATKCSDRITSTACEAGYKLDVNECKAIVCKAPQSVVSDDNTGCCFDPQATKCSSPEVATACTDLYDLKGIVCSRNDVCPVPTYKAKLGFLIVFLATADKGCCMDPYATACSNDFFSTACVAGRRFSKSSCIPLKCEAPYYKAKDDTGCCADPYATACSSALVPSKCRSGYHIEGIAPTDRICVKDT